MHFSVFSCRHLGLLRCNLKKNTITPLTAEEVYLDLFAVWRLAQHVAEQQQEYVGLHHVVSRVASLIHLVLVNKKWSCECSSGAVCAAACL